MAVLVTLDSLRSYTRGLDERLVDIKKYSDSWIDSKINAAYEIIGSAGQSFQSEEVLDLTEYIKDSTKKFEVEMDHDVTGWKAAFYEENGEYQYDYPLASRYASGDPVAIQIKPDNKVEVDIKDGIRQDSTHTINFQYYYFPNTNTGDQYFSTDVYHMVRHAIASTTFDALRDYEQRDNYDNQLAKQIRTIVNTWDYDGSNVRDGNWNV